MGDGRRSGNVVMARFVCEVRDGGDGVDVVGPEGGHGRQRCVAQEELWRSLSLRHEAWVS